MGDTKRDGVEAGRDSLFGGKMIKLGVTSDGAYEVAVNHICGAPYLCILGEGGNVETFIDFDTVKCAGGAMECIESAAMAYLGGLSKEPGKA